MIRNDQKNECQNDDRTFKHVQGNNMRNFSQTA